MLNSKFIFRHYDIKKKISPLSKSGVNEVKCNDCDKKTLELIRKFNI